MKPQMLVVALGAAAAIVGARYLDLAILETFGLVIVGMFGSLFLYRRFSK